ncbi:MAG: rhomboid family intramembrane serine protease [Sulfolobales archaeon]
MTYSIILLNVLIYAIFSWKNNFLYIDPSIVARYGFSPARLYEVRDLETLITSMFIHGNIFHIFFNMYVLYYFGKELETLLNRHRYLLLYLLSGVFGSLFYTITLPMLYGGFNIYAIGASGAISGLLGGYFMVYPRRILTLCIFAPIPICGSFTVSIFLIIWIFINLIYGLFIGGNIAFFAHIGGFIGGVTLTYLLSRKVISEIILMSRSLLNIDEEYEKRGLGVFSKALILLLIVTPMIIIIYNSSHILYLSLVYRIFYQVLFSLIISLIISISSIYIVLFKDKELDIS